MKGVKDKRRCVKCRRHKSIFTFDILYVPRSPPTSGWVRHVCNECVSDGESMKRDEKIIREQIEKTEDKMKEMKSKLSELKKIIQYIESGGISSMADKEND